MVSSLTELIYFLMIKRGLTRIRTQDLRVVKRIKFVMYADGIQIFLQSDFDPLTLPVKLLFAQLCTSDVQRFRMLL